jgi:hypothetical protein
MLSGKEQRVNNHNLVVLEGVGEQARMGGCPGLGNRPLHPAGNPAKFDPFFENTAR